jgi:type II restriction/modification system DNA methylase subunit YeeA
LDGARLDGVAVQEIHADLTASEDSGGVNLTLAQPLPENRGVAFSGITKKGKFEVDGNKARAMLLEPANPNGRPNSDVVRSWKNGDAVTSRDPDKWIVNFGERSEEEAALYASPFELVARNVKPARDKSNSAGEKRMWWLLARRAPDLFAALQGFTRFLATPEVSKHRVFVWLDSTVIPDKNLVAIARDDDTTFGVLQSRHHALWALRLGTSLEDRPRYTSTTTFRTFPFPDGLTPNIAAAKFVADPRAARIAEAAKKVHALRSAWLNPAEWVKRVPEVVPGFPDRLVPVDDKAAAELKRRTLTILYNEHPAWLVNAHRQLDEAVATAYGWTDYTAEMADEEILKRLLDLNLKRTAAAHGH